MRFGMTIRKKIILLFIGLITLPVIVTYFVVSNFFIQSTQDDMANLFAANIYEVGRNTEIFFDNAIHLSIYPLLDMNLMNFLMASYDSPEYTEIKENASNIIQATLFGHANIIYGFRLTNMYQDTIFSGSIPEISEEDQMNARGMEYRPYWDFNNNNTDSGYLYLIRLLRNPHSLSQDIGAVKISLNSSDLRDFIRSPQVEQTTSYFIIARDGSHPIITGDIHESNINPEMLTFQNLYEVANSPRSSVVVDDYIVSAYYLRSTDLIVYSITEADILSETRIAILTNVFIYSVLVFVFCVFIAIFFSKIITRPIKIMGEHMDSIAREDFGVRYPVRGSDEMASLSKHFNQMAEKLEFLYKEVYQGELKLKQSQIDMLEAQINPHFLYNTLDTIYWMVQMGETEKSATMVSNMSKMMRLTLAPKSNDGIPLAQELEHLQCYVEIQKIRFNNKVDFEMSYPEHLLKQHVLSFILQPLVENAFIHGMKDDLHGIVKVKIFESETEIIYEISNNGKLIDVSEIDSLLSNEQQNYRGFALRNLKDRLILRYGDAQRLTYYIDGEFSVFRITQTKERL